MPTALKRPIIFLAFGSAWNAVALPSLPAEARGLRAILEPLDETGRINLVLRQDVTTGEVLDHFQDQRYTGRVAIFHFAGHADQYGLLLSDSTGGLQKTHAAGFAAFLAEQPGLRLVFLNGCATDAQADDLLAAGVPAVVTTQTDTPDDLAVEFAARFYKGLAGGAGIESAYRAAEAAARTALGAALVVPWKLHLHSNKPDAGVWTIPKASIEENAAEKERNGSELNQKIGQIDLRGAQGVNIRNSGPITQSFGPMTNTWGPETAKPG